MIKHKLRVNPSVMPAVSAGAEFFCGLTFIMYFYIYERYILELKITDACTPVSQMALLHNHGFIQIL